jgi:hypothetical protein
MEMCQCGGALCSCCMYAPLRLLASPLSDPVDIVMVKLPCLLVVLAQCCTEREAWGAYRQEGASCQLAFALQSTTAAGHHTPLAVTGTPCATAEGVHSLPGGLPPPPPAAMTAAALRHQT